MESDAHSDHTPRSSTSVRATLGTLDYVDSTLSPRNVSSRSRPSRRHVGKSVKSPVEAPGTTHWERAFNAQFEETENMTNSATADVNVDSDVDKDSNDSLSIDLLFSDDGSVTRSVDGSKSARTNRLTNTRTQRRITFQNDEDGADVIPPRSRKPVRVAPRRRNSVSSCGSSASTSSTPLSPRGSRPAQETSPRVELSVGSDEVLPNLMGLGTGPVVGTGIKAGVETGLGARTVTEARAVAGRGIEAGKGSGLGEEKTREEAEGRPWRNLIPWDLSSDRKSGGERNKLPSDTPADITKGKSSPTRGRYHSTGTSGIPPHNMGNYGRNERNRSRSPSRIQPEPGILLGVMQQCGTEKPLCVIIEEEEREL
jgi:hypothetical protein